MPKRQPLREGLKPRLPEGCLDTVIAWIGDRPVHIRITRGRASKLGDYRPPQKDNLHRISVNGDLNPFEFLITLTHELAHMLVWEQYQRRIQPHGTAWKKQYAGMLRQLLELKVFPEELHDRVSKQVDHPKATSKTDAALTRALDDHNAGTMGVYLEDLPHGAFFYLRDGRKFQKHEKLRKWYRCISQDNRRPYRISPVARVVPA